MCLRFESKSIYYFRRYNDFRDDQMTNMLKEMLSRLVDEFASELAEECASEKKKAG